MSESNPYSTNKAAIRGRAYYWANKARIDARAREWAKGWRKKPENKLKIKVVKRRADLKGKFGMTPEQFDSMAASQGFACAICKVVPDYTLHVDHDHKNNRVRGLLCSNCNTALGLLKDNAEFLSRAINYLSL